MGRYYSHVSVSCIVKPISKAESQPFMSFVALCSIKSGELSTRTRFESSVGHGSDLLVIRDVVARSKAGDSQPKGLS